MDGNVQMRFLLGVECNFCRYIAGRHLEVDFQLNTVLASVDQLLLSSQDSTLELNSLMGVVISGAWFHAARSGEPCHHFLI